MTAFPLLGEELAAWAEQDAAPSLWLRDDDAIAATPALDRLLALSNDYQAPILLAVIPQPANGSLARRLASEPLITPCQHGFAHLNHAAEGSRAVELGGRDLGRVEAELLEGRQRLADLFGAACMPLLVPPWNRIDAALPARLPALGFETLSTFGAPRFADVPGLRELNCHVDLIDWRGGRQGKSVVRLDRELAEAFAAARRQGGGTVGLLAHHLAHDELAWSVLGALYAWLNERADVAFLSPAQALSRP